jgi:GntR family negative regulator for fad regulon and positive regulator of fabA
MHRETPPKPGGHAESALVAAILDGSYPPGSVLPGERELAAQFGVTRPTLREAIQRLARDGWLTVAQGKQTRVNDFWKEGGLNVLSTLVAYEKHLPLNFVGQLLEVRYYLAPAYTSAAVANAPLTVVNILAPADDLDDDPVEYARFDWGLHHHLTICSGNPIFTLILNGFKDFYEKVARQYFASSYSRTVSASFYRDLRIVAAAGDVDEAEALCRRVMLTSIQVWQAEANAVKV